MSDHPGATLAAFVSGLTYDQLPESVVERTVDLFLDWIGSALGGAKEAPVVGLAGVMEELVPATGPAEVLISRKRRSALHAAAVNAASSHVMEQDDVHNGSVFHPGAVVFPAALATAQQIHGNGRSFITAAVAGYETGIRTGEFLGRSHYKIFHTTGTAGTLATAAATGSLLGLDQQQMLDAFGSAGTQSAGVWEFLREGAHSKQLHTAHAATAGLLSACLAQKGFRGAHRIFDGEQGMAAGMSTDANPDRLTDALGDRWAIMETSFKFHAACRHTHPAADALLLLIKEHRLNWRDISHITAHVHQGAIDVLGQVTNPATVHQAKFSMGTVLGLIAVHGAAGIDEFEQHFQDDDVVKIRNKVHMILDSIVDEAYPKKWIGKIQVETRDGERLLARVDEPRGDPGNTLNRDEIVHKAIALARHSGVANEKEVLMIAEKVSTLADLRDVFVFEETPA